MQYERRNISTVWNDETIPFKITPYEGSLSTQIKTSKYGDWHTFKYEIDIPVHGKYGVTFPEMSYLGGLFGLSFGFLCSSMTTPLPNVDETTAKMWKHWSKFSPRKASFPEYYVISNLSISIIDSDPKASRHTSISRFANLNLYDFLSKVAHTSPISSFFKSETQFPISTLPVFRSGLAFAALFESATLGVTERVSKTGVVASSSDDVWIADDLRVKTSTEKIRVSLYHSEFIKSKKIITGCQGLSRDPYRLFSKSKKMRKLLLFNPLGLNRGDHRNCVLECLAYHLQVNPTFTTLTVEEFWQSPLIKEYEKDTIDLTNSELLQKLSDLVCFPIACFVETIVNSEHTFEVLQWPQAKNMAVNHESTLRLLAHCQGIDEFGNPIWHAVVVESFGAIKDKKLCNTCGEWFTRNSVHFTNCKVCDKCSKAYNASGNHYISCKGKAILSSKAKAEGKISPSGINHQEWQLGKNVWFCDFECFQNKHGTHIPYLVALKSISQNNTITFWGENCLENFTNYITDPAKKVMGYLYCHNGSGYDFNLILVGILQRNKKILAQVQEYLEAEEVDAKTECKPLNVLMRGNKILTCEISRKPPLSLRDTYLLMPASLSKLCKDLKIKQEFAKTHFDHSKIKSFSDAEKYREEVTKYCIQDVVALEQIFSLFAKAMWNIAPVLLQSSMSLASHALEMWKIIEKGPVLNSLCLPDYEIYQTLREMYHGGRVLATVPKYDSELFEYVTQENEAGEFTFFDEDGNTLMDFWEIKENLKILDGKETLKQVDVVSLYPHVMESQVFPTGAFIPPEFFTHEDGIAHAIQISTTINYGKYTSFEHDGDHVTVENPGYTLLKMEMFRYCYFVDMDCPENALVAFLMRKVDDAPVQNLAPLRRHWVTGVELFEAIKVGYTLLKVHGKFGWEALNPVFKKYIGILFKIKEENKHDKSSVMYIVAKLLMNALSGKFGQKIVSKVTKLMVELPDNPDEHFSKLQNIHTQLIESIKEDGAKLPIGFLFTGEKKQEDMETNLPTHLSVFILAHSRRKMSKMLRHVNGYYDKTRTLLYTDTDSMCITQSTFNILKKDGFIGGKLGQLEDEFPHDIIVAGRFLAPKVYVLMMLKQFPNSEKAGIAYKVRCKGIPHRGDVFFANSYALDEREFKVRLDEINDSITGPVEDLGKRFYVIKSKETETPILIHPFINISICDLILSQKYFLQIHFGSILKDTKTKFSLKSTWVTRSLGFNSWWHNPDCPRIMSDLEGYEITSCKTV